MHREQLSFINPNYLHGCHPLDLRSYFKDSPFAQNIDKRFPLATPRTNISSPTISTRRRVLEYILENISRSDLPCREYFVQYENVDIIDLKYL